MNGKEFYKEQLTGISKNINDWIEEGFNLIVSLVKENGGFLKTIQCEEKPTLCAFYEDYDGRKSSTWIQGFHYDDELGLCICTNEMLDNYQFDNGYEFQYYWNFEGDDLTEVNKALDDASYYVGFNEYDLKKTDTILNILAGLSAYL